MPGGYALRPVVVASDLGALRGPLSGRHQLPLHLDASARAVYDLADPDDREHAYQLVLLEASCPPTWSSGWTAPRSSDCGPSSTCPESCAPPGRPNNPRWPGSAPGPGSPSWRRCVPMPMDPFQARVAQVALHAAAGADVSPGGRQRADRPRAADRA